MIKCFECKYNKFVKAPSELHRDINVCNIKFPIGIYVPEHLDRIIYNENASGCDLGVAAGFWEMKRRDKRNGN